MRFSGNPQKNPITGSELLPATDTATGNDASITPTALTQFVQNNMGLANGTSQGAVSGPNGAKLNDLRTKAQDDLLLAQLGQVPFPIFIGSPVNGFIEIFRNVLNNSIVLDFMWFALASGSTTLTVRIDGSPVTGMDNIPVTTISSGAVATANKILPAGSILGLTFANSNSPQNLRLSIKGNLTLT